jgi:plasmid maintenance system antidote protein VapI
MIQSIYQLFHPINEQFAIPKLNEIPRPFINNPFMKKYDVNAEELHSTIANFEIPASNISFEQRRLRRKYLITLLKAFDQEQQLIININPFIASNIKRNKENYDALVILIKRIINLMINEIDVIDNKNKKINEEFIIPKLNEIPKPFIDNKFMKKYFVNPEELHSTIANFELPASNITFKQRRLRHKYLIILLKAIDQEQETIININPYISSNIKKHQENYNSLIVLIKRIINLMINEIDVIDNKSNPINEQFVIPKLNEIPKPFIDNPFMKKYDVNAEELHSTIANFELPASNISFEQRKLRRKYLLALLKAVDQEQQLIININPFIASNIRQNKENYNALIILIKRIINLMINEIDVIDKKNNPINEQFTVKKKDNSTFYMLIGLAVIMYFLFIKK